MTNVRVYCVQCFRRTGETSIDPTHCDRSYCPWKGIVAPRADSGSYADDVAYEAVKRELESDDTNEDIDAGTHDWVPIVALVLFIALIAIGGIIHAFKDIAEAFTNAK